MIKEIEISSAIAKANEANDYFGLTFTTGGQPYKPANFVLEGCEKLGVGKVQLLEIPIHWKDSAVWSMSVMSEAHTDIVLAQGLNFCWENYCVCKELFHILIDNEDSRDMDLDHATAVEALGLDFEPAAPGYFAKAAEQQAEMAAMEFLFPYRNRLHILALPVMPSFRTIAEQYKVPELMIDRYLSSIFMKDLEEASRK